METEALIIGAGVPGLTLAAFLGRLGLDVCMVDPDDLRTPAAGTQGRTSALMQGSVNILTQAGVWGAVQNETGALRVLRIVDDSGSKPVQIDFDAGDIGLDAFARNCPNGILRKALIEHVRTIKTVKLLDKTRLEGFHVDGLLVRARLNSGKDVKARIIIGADGHNSVVRRCAGIEIHTRDYGQSAITCVIDHALSHKDISTEFHRPGGPFTLVPLPGMRSSVVWVERTEDAQSLMKLKKKDFEQTMLDRSHGQLGTISLVSTPECWPLKALAAKSLTAPRTVLVAEAAHVISPIGAQGLNLSLRDAATLAEVLADAARRGEDIGSPLVLDRYTQRRRADIASRVVGVDGLNRIVSNNLGFLRGLRKLGLKTLDSIPALKNLAIRHGMNPALDDGRLIRGQTL